MSVKTGWTAVNRPSPYARADIERTADRRPAFPCTRSRHVSSDFAPSPPAATAARHQFAALITTLLGIGTSQRQRAGELDAVGRFARRLCDAYCVATRA